VASAIDPVEGDAVGELGLCAFLAERTGQDIALAFDYLCNVFKGSSVSSLVNVIYFFPIVCIADIATLPFFIFLEQSLQKHSC